MAQQSYIPLNSFYKDQLFANKLEQPYTGGSFFPATESEYNLISAINDSSAQFYDFTYVLFQKHLIELNGKDYSLSISPILDFRMGKDFNDTNNRKLFQNTRGVYVEGDLFKNFSFSTSLFENQARVNYYEDSYYRGVGELYPKSDSTYASQNAVIPGGGRTKPFKGDGFDYASAVGYFVYAPFKKLNVSVGNNRLFIGDGHRSILHSDNSYNSPYIRINWSFFNHFQFTYLRSRHLNLMRKPASGSVESYYEAKGYSINYFTYQPNKKIGISLFESGVWNRGDAYTSKNSHPLIYNPIPFISSIALAKKGEVSALHGLNLSYQLAKNHRFYGQFALNNFDVEKNAFQVGYRGYNYFGIGDFMLQLEYNNVAANTYVNDNKRLNNVHYNLPVAHSKGNGFQEFLLRTNFEYKRMYVASASHYYITEHYSSFSLLPVDRELELSSGQTFFETLELGYRFNRKMNLMLFGKWTYRTEFDNNTPNTNSIHFGLRTGFTNHYNDF